MEQLSTLMMGSRFVRPVQSKLGDRGFPVFCSLFSCTERFCSYSALVLFVSLFGEQEQSFATNHMETGVHIGKGTIQHLPEDYVVPLFKEGDATFWRRESLLLPKASEKAFFLLPSCKVGLARAGFVWTHGV